MSYKEAIDQIGDLMILCEFAVTNLRVVQTALNEKVVSAAEGGDALFTTCEYLKDLHDQMNAIVKQAVQTNRVQNTELGACA